MDEAPLQTIESPVKVTIEKNERSKSSSRVSNKDLKAAIEISQQNYATNRNAAEGMMDLALLTANANQLRFFLTYNTHSPTFYLSVGLITISLVLQVAVGIGLIFKRKNAKKSKMLPTNRSLVVGIFIITFVNILVAAFTSMDNNANAK